MNFLRGMMDVVPSNWVGAKAIRQIKDEKNNYREREYSFRFDLTETIITTDNWNRGIEFSFGYAKLTYNYHVFVQNFEMMGTIQTGSLTSTLMKLGRWNADWLRGVSRITEHRWNHEVLNFMQAFLNGDPMIHNRIRAAILRSMKKTVCPTCFEEITKDHNCS